jgi:hypothetical protein
VDKLRLAIRDRDGQDIVNPDLLTGQIKKSGLSIDGTKLYGSDNFIIDARRLKCDIKLVNNSRINDTLISNLTSESLLVEDNLTSTELPVTVFSKDRLRDVFSEENLFYREKNFPDGQTWSIENADSGRFVIQSIDMLEIIYTGIRNFYNSNAYNSGASSYREYGVSFKYCLQNIVAFLVRGLKIHYSRPLNDSDTDYTPGKMLVAYLNEIDSRDGGLGSVLNTYVNSQVTGDIDIENNFGDQRYVYGILFHIARYLRDNQTTNGYSVVLPSDSDYSNEIPFFAVDTIVEQHSNMAIFLVSLLQKSWYDAVNAEFYDNGYNQLYMPNVYTHFNYGGYSIGAWQYVPLFKVQEVVNRYPWHVLGNVFWTAKFNMFINGSILQSSIREHRNLICVDSPINELMFGKIQTATVEDELPSGIPIINNWETLTEMFNPVKRYFKIEGISTEYKFYLDNIALGSETKSTNSYLGMTGFDEFNWMYFDKITCYEELSNTIFVDNYPMYDEDGQESDEYGLYLYSDFFNKYYTKTKSNLMDLYVYLYSGNNLIYSGIIDYSTVVHNIRDNTISFEATDAIGVLIENLRKLSSFINFSQFDTGDMITAEPRAGSTIGQFIKTVINNPLPYYTALNGTIDQNTDMDGFNNKVLEEISAEDAFIIGVQMSKKLLFVNQTTGKIELQTINESAVLTTIADEAIISLEYQQEVGGDMFSIDKLKKVAGFDKIAPSIAAYYNSVMLKYRKTISLELFMQDNDINVLDRILVRNKYYIVMSVDYDIMSRKIRVTATEIR